MCGDSTSASDVQKLMGGELADCLVTDPPYNVNYGGDASNPTNQGKHRLIEKPKRKKIKHTVKVLRSETRVAEKLRLGEKVLNSELRKDLAYLSREMQSNNLGG